MFRVVCDMMVYQVAATVHSYVACYMLYAHMWYI